MSDAEVLDLYAQSRAKFVQAGVEMLVIEDMDVARQLLAASDKPYLSRYLASEFNDFTSENSFCVILKRAGKIVGSLGCRCDRIPKGGISKFWANQEQRLYSAVIDPQNRPPIIEEIGGVVAYFGDLWLAAKSDIDVTTLVMSAYILAYHKWRPDWYYAFISDRDASRRQLHSLRMPHCYPGGHLWASEPPEMRSNTDWLIAMRDADLHFIAREMLRRADQPGKVDNQVFSIRAVNR